MCGFREKRVKKVRITLCTFGTANFFTPKSPEVFGKPEKYEMRRAESHRGKKAKSGGSDPTFLRRSRPKVSWGRSRPAARVLVPAFLPR